MAVYTQVDADRLIGRHRHPACDGPPRKGRKPAQLVCSHRINESAGSSSLGRWHVSPTVTSLVIAHAS
jgi:hypothetical protein